MPPSHEATGCEAEQTEQETPTDLQGVKHKAKLYWLIGSVAVVLIIPILFVAIHVIPISTSSKEFHNALKDGTPGPKMVIIPAGTFMMGSPVSEIKRNDNEKQHQVQSTIDVKLIVAATSWEILLCLYQVTAAVRRISRANCPGSYRMAVRT